MACEELEKRVADLEARLAEWEDDYYVPPKRKAGPKLPPPEDEDAWFELGRKRLPHS